MNVLDQKEPSCRCALLSLLSREKVAVRPDEGAFATIGTLAELLTQPTELLIQCAAAESQ
jgi:hypothetical protein